MATYAENFGRHVPFRMDYRMRRADGAWRFLVDNGSGSGTGPSPAPDAEPAIVRPGRAGGAATAFNEVRVAEATIATGGFGVGRWLAGDAWLLRGDHEAATGKAAPRWRARIRAAPTRRSAAAPRPTATSSMSTAAPSPRRRAALTSTSGSAALAAGRS